MDGARTLTTSAMQGNLAAASRSDPLGREHGKQTLMTLTTANG
jgi:hypothetical protein